MNKIPISGHCDNSIQFKGNKNFTALKSNSNTVWFNFQTYIYIVNNPVNNGEGFSQCIHNISLASKWCKVIDVYNINMVPVLFLQTCELVMGNQFV